ncbi:hypothetical protein DPMN_125660 [Dreissena polymorpha]|uniref:Uncharacterized protein n=1 Tax=Dreissena polymorpha TaxID=45954 RepID=A0A9D4JX98_DREPO|nr:hypothetical protein DPMN_125660 [Dreissena polymorpha]
MGFNQLRSQKIVQMGRLKCSWSCVTQVVNNVSDFIVARKSVCVCDEWTLMFD